MRSYSFLLVLAVASPALAQTATTAGTSSPTADVRANWRTMSGYVLQSAIDVPENKYSYKPTAKVRSFGELFAHVAGAQSMFCALALGEKAPSEDAVKAKTKAELVEALRQSNRDCERAYAQSDADVAANVDMFGEQHSRLYVLMTNATHDGEHYGNLITYMRMNGMVPPSSRPAGR